MPFTGLDTTAIARSLSQIADRPDDVADVFVERLEEIEMVPQEWSATPRIRREEGLAVRLVRGGRTWIATGDLIDSPEFMEALGHVARARPTAAYQPPRFDLPPFAEVGDLSRMAMFPALVQRAIRQRHAAFPFRISLRRHRRWLRVVGPRLAAEQETECFFSLTVELPFGQYGALLPTLERGAVDQVAGGLLGLFRARDAPAVDSHHGVTVLGPAASAVLLHEVVAHALETDTLASGGRAEAAVGLRIGSECLDVLDDPGSAPEGVRRVTDDEGVATIKRWLLRKGVVEQPLADLVSASGSSRLMAGAGRRGSRHLPPAPRSTYLELLPGEHSDEELLADAGKGLYVPEVSQGRLDPQTGRFTLYVPHARRIESGRKVDVVGPCRLTGAVSELLDSVVGVGADTRCAGAGWCAKSGIKLAVWASTPSLRVEGVELVS